jgi:hypothetical protein
MRFVRAKWTERGDAGEIVRVLIAIRPPATAARWEIRLRD